MTEQLKWENKNYILREIEDFLKDLMPEKNAYIERRCNKLVISGVMAFARNIRNKGEEILSKIQNSSYFENVKVEKSVPLIILADLKNPIEGISKIHFEIDKDM